MLCGVELVKLSGGYRKSITYKKDLQWNETKDLVSRPLSPSTTQVAEITVLILRLASTCYNYILILISMYCVTIQ